MREPDVRLVGRFERGEERRYVTVPFEVPDDVWQIHFEIDYTDRISSDPSVGGGNTLDIGLFTSVDAASGRPGFRGWSGSDRVRFTIGERESTPPYQAGEIEAGTWGLLLGPYKIGPRGLDYRVEIWFNLGVRPEVPEVLRTNIGAIEPVPAAAEPGWARGDLHCHSLFSDGDSWPSELLIRAAEIGLDFLAITDHNSAVFMPRPDDPPGLPFLLNGTEVTTYRGHWNVWGVRDWFDFRYPEAAAVQAEMQRAVDEGGFVSISHPRPWGPDWEYDGITANLAVEVWNGPWGMLNPVCVAFWEDQLASGRRVVAVGGSDTHELRGGGTGLLPPPTLGTPTTWIEVGDRLTTDTLLTGLREGRCFISASPAGPQLYVRRQDDRINVRVVGAEGQRLEVVHNGQNLDEHRIDSDDWWWEARLPDGVPYVRMQVSDDRDYVLALANPIWIEG